MKYLVFILSLIFCFSGCVTKPEPVVEEAPPPPPPPPRADFSQRILVNQEIVNWIKQLDESEDEYDDINRLIFFLDREFTLEIDDMDNEPIVEIGRDGMLIISAKNAPPMFRFSTFQQGKIEIFTPSSNETFIIGITADGEPVSMKFRKNARFDYFEIYSMEFPSGNYNIKSEEEFPKLYIYATIDENIRNARTHSADFIAVPSNLLGLYRPTTPVPRESVEHQEVERQEETRSRNEVSSIERQEEERHEETRPRNEVSSLRNEVSSERIEVVNENAESTEDSENVAEAEETNENEIVIEHNTENVTVTPNVGTDNYVTRVETPRQTAEPTPQPPVQQTQPVPTPAPAQPTQTPAAQITQSNTTPRAAKTTSARSRRSSNIIAAGTLTADTIFNFIKSKPHTTVFNDALIKELIQLYIDEARYEEVNHDFAIAQMLYQTTMLSNRQFVRANNFGGLTPVRGKFDGTFPNMERGVRAHIHQLRGYSKGTVVRSPILSPRWEMISNSNKGNVQTFNQLYDKWSAYPRYGQKIEELLADMYQFSDNSASR